MFLSYKTVQPYTYMSQTEPNDNHDIKQANPVLLIFITSYKTYSWLFLEMLGCGGSQPEGGRYK